MWNKQTSRDPCINTAGELSTAVGGKAVDNRCQNTCDLYPPCADSYPHLWATLWLVIPETLLRLGCGLSTAVELHVCKSFTALDNSSHELPTACVQLFPGHVDNPVNSASRQSASCAACVPGSELHACKLLTNVGIPVDKGCMRCGHGLRAAAEAAGYAAGPRINLRGPADAAAVRT